MGYTNELDELMEDICDRCRYPLEVGEQEQLDDICFSCPIRDEIESLMRQ